MTLKDGRAMSVGPAGPTLVFQRTGDEWKVVHSDESAAPGPLPQALVAGLPAERVTGIGGVFFRARDPRALSVWYREKLGRAAGEGAPALTRGLWRWSLRS